MARKHNILIVDDTPLNLQVLGDMLEQQGYEVRIATNGKEALRAAAASPPDLILLDIMMPEMDGYEVCRRLKADAELRLTPVIFISALGMAEQKVQAFREGAVDYVTKPFQSEEVVSRVHTHIQLAQMEELKREIAERIRAEEENAKLQAQLQQSQKMEAVGRLAGGVAHDFNNMLGVILGYAEMSLMRIDQSNPLYLPITEISKAAQRSADLTRQLLAFARKQAIEPRVLDINETVSGMLKMLQRMIGEDIVLAWQPTTGLWPVRVDPSQIDQILANLIINARDAIKGVGRVTIETENRVIDSDYCALHPDMAPGDYVRLSVRDSGCGMDKVTLDLIFEPFFTTKEAGKGTGLGLATVFGIVKQNRGSIDVYSEPGHGTTFVIYLPRHQGMDEPGCNTSTFEHPSHGNETILLVEDEAAMLGMTSSMLQTLGYKVLAANSPNDAIRQAVEYPGEIDLLLTDIIMPEMNGRDLAAKLLSLYPQIKSLFMSGYTTSVIAHGGAVDEVVHFLRKPYSLSALAAKVHEVLNY